MRTIKRALRSVGRSPLRSGMMLGLLAVCTALALLMLTVDGAFADRLDQIRAEVGTEVTVRPAGAIPGAFMVVGGELPTLTQDDLAALDGLEHVVGTNRTVNVSYTGDGLRAAEPELPEGMVAGRAVGLGGETFKPPVNVVGTEAPDDLRLMDNAQTSLTEGRTFTEDESDADVAVIGRALADANDLTIGSTFDLNGTTVEVIGIFDSDQFFGDNTVFMPLASIQRIFEKPAEISQLVLQVDTIDNVQAVADEARSRIGDEVADVSSSLDQYEPIGEPLEEARTSSRVGLIAALGASAVVILLSVALAARARLKEIGILKALGAGTRHVALQVGVESLVVSLVAALVGASLTFPFAQRLASGLVPDPGLPGALSIGEGGDFTAAAPIAGDAGGAFRFGGPGGDLIGELTVAVEPRVFFYALVLAIGLALLASVVPAWQVARIKPAEVLRHE